MSNTAFADPSDDDDVPARHNDMLAALFDALADIEFIQQRMGEQPQQRPQSDQNPSPVVSPSQTLETALRATASVRTRHPRATPTQRRGC
jgi:hypothetical protein